MANIINNNFHNLKLLINHDEYWDFFLNKDEEVFGSSSYQGKSLYDKCLISYIDADIYECVAEDKLLLSTDSYAWESAVTTPYLLYNIGYTGVDNGLISFRRDMINNKQFLDIYSNSTYSIPSGDTRLKLHAVSGATNIYDYPITVEENRIKLNGGFYQGFYETECDKYQILPSTLENGDTWEFEFVLNKTEFEKESNKTLNDSHPNNKGIFFFLGTRAENKWAYMYNKDDECFALSYDDYIDGGEIKKNEYKINNFLDAEPDFEDWEETAIDDYMSAKYYSNELYKDDCLTSDDFFGDDYLDVDNKPKIIDEDKHKYTVLGWCCGYNTDTTEEEFKIVCCRCGWCRKVRVEHLHIETKQGSYLSKCDFFGDDILADFDSIDDGTEYFESDIDISNFNWETYEGGALVLNTYHVDTDNKFLTHDRTCNGFNVHTWTEGTIVRYYGRRSAFKGNLFLLLNRTCTGYTVKNIDEYINSFSAEYNIYKDIYNNALAFRITDKGEIGYRYCALDCESDTQTAIIEGYSKEGIIQENKWHVVNVKIEGKGKTMQLYFYVDGELVFVSKEMDKIDLRKLKEDDEKQEGVPYNLSLGGGTQGLADVILPNYMLDPYRLYPLEEFFAGTFIGYIKSFKFFNCSMEWLAIHNNFVYEINKLKQLNIYK